MVRSQGRMIKKILIFSVMIHLLFLAGCAGLADYSIDLPGNLSVIRTSANNVTIAPNNGEDSWGANLVPAEVVEVGWNDEYIIAKQKDSSDTYYFWVIEIDNKEVTGPLNESDFADKKEEFGYDVQLIEVQDLINT